METCKNKDWFNKISKAPNHFFFNEIAETLETFHKSGDLARIVSTLLHQINKTVEEGCEDIREEYSATAKYITEDVYYCTETIRILITIFENWRWAKQISR